MRDAEIKSLTWGQIHLEKGYLEVGKSKTAAGEGRTIPINSVLRQAILIHRAQYEEKFQTIADEWYVFPFGKPRPSDPTRPVTTLKTAWKNVRKNANITGRWHDHRRTSFDTWPTIWRMVSSPAPEAVTKREFSTRPLDFLPSCFRHWP